MMYTGKYVNVAMNETLFYSTIYVKVRLLTFAQNTNKIIQTGNTGNISKLQQQKT